MSIQLKVNRLELIDKLEAAKIARQVKYQKDLSQYEADVKTKTKAAIKELKKKLVKGQIEFNYSGAGLTSNVKLKYSKPSSPKFDGLEEQLRKLKMATNEMLTVSDKSDYFRYL